MLELILDVTRRPAVLVVLILLSTYILEDVAIITAALISIDGFIPPELAFLGLFIGIFTGDLGVYGIGRLLDYWPWLKKKIPEGKLDTVGNWLKQNVVWTVLFVRLVPGLRLPSYIACGFFRYSFLLFSFWVCLATLVWTGVVFLGLYWFGSMFWGEFNSFKWLILPIIIIAILFLHRMAKPSFSKLYATKECSEKESVKNP